MRLFILCMKFRLTTNSSLSREILWSIQGTATLLVGLERNSLLSQVQGRRRIHHRRNVKCITQTLIFGLKCQIWTLAVIITHHAPSETLQSMCSVESRTQPESTSILLSDTISPTSLSGHKLISTTKCSQRGKDVEQFKRMDSLSSSLEVSQVNSLVTATISIVWAISYHVHLTLPMIYFCSRCQLSMMHKHLQSTAVTCKGIRFIGSTTEIIGVYIRLCVLRSETDEFTVNKKIRLVCTLSHFN